MPFMLSDFERCTWAMVLGHNICMSAHSDTRKIPSRLQSFKAYSELPWIGHVHIPHPSDGVNPRNRTPRVITFWRTCCSKSIISWHKLNDSGGAELECVHRIIACIILQKIGMLWRSTPINIFSVISFKRVLPGITIPSPMKNWMALSRSTTNVTQTSRTLPLRYFPSSFKFIIVLLHSQHQKNGLWS